jgi:hypothetical protein
VTIATLALLALLLPAGTPEARVTLLIQGRSVPLSDGERADVARGAETLIVGCAINSVTSPGMFSARSLNTEWNDARTGSHLYVRFPRPPRSQGKELPISEVVIGFAHPSLIGPELSRHRNQVTGYVKCEGHRSLALMCAPSIRPHLLSGQERACDVNDRVGEPRETTEGK